MRDEKQDIVVRLNDVAGLLPDYDAVVVPRADLEAAAAEIARLRSQVRELQASLANRMTPGLNAIDDGARNSRSAAALTTARTGEE